MAFDRYQSFSGFWDAVRRSVTLPKEVSLEDFRSCPSCYASELSFTPSALFAAVEADVIEPLRSVQELIDRSPYTTRLYSTLSAAEMTLDPVFVVNPDLPDVNNVHQANRVIECGPGVYDFEAPWHIDFPQGTSIRGTPDQVGQWPTAVDEQPPNFRVLTLAASGEGAIVADNSAMISSMLAEYNAAVPRADAGNGGFCNIGGALGSSLDGPRSQSPGWLALVLGVLLGRAGSRRPRARQDARPLGADALGG